MLDNVLLFTATDLKQFTYCPRVVFYERCLSHIRPITAKMEAGAEAHEDEPKRAVRRTLGGYDVLAGQRRFDVHLTSPRLHLTGIVDEVVYTNEGEVFPVDYKLAKKVGDQHRLQLTAYALLLEDATATPIGRGYVYLMLTKQLVKIEITPDLRTRLAQLMNQMRRMVEQEHMPFRSKNQAICTACEFRRFCNDV